MLISGDALHAGFSDPVFDSQSVFRSALEALSRPGTVQSIGTLTEELPPFMPATLALCLALMDFETPVWIQPCAADRHASVAAYLRFHCSCPLVSAPGAARFALVHDASAMPDLDAFGAGSSDYPDRSATLIVQVQHLVPGTGMRLQGPGIRDANHLDIAGLPARFWEQWQANTAMFPCGVDVIFTSGDRLAGLPRTIHAKHTKHEKEPPCMSR